jgi:hypothetical protein
MPPRFSFPWHRTRGGVDSTCRFVSTASCGVEDEAVWSSHPASFPLFPGATKTRRRGAHTPPRFPSFSRHRRRDGVEPTRRLVSPLSLSIEDEAAWTPHAASFPLFPAASKTRRHETHTPPCFFSRQPCLSSLTPQQHRDLTQLPSIRCPSLSFSYFTLIYGFLPVFYIFFARI